MNVGKVGLAIVFCVVMAGWVKGQADSLVLVQPVGGEILYTNRDSSLTIQWTGVSDTLPVRIEWSNDGRKWNIIADSATGLQYQWLFKSIPISSTYRIRVLQARAPLGSDNTTYTGHNGVVTAGAWSPSSKRAVSVSATPDIWDVSVGGSTPLVSLNTLRAKLLGVVWTRDSSKIWVIDQGINGLLAFETVTNGQVYQYNCNCDAFKFAVSASGTRVVVAGLRSVHVVDYPNPAATRQILSTSDVLDVTLDSTETKVLVCNDQASVYSIAGGLPLVFRKHFGGVLAGAFQPYGTSVATIGGDATLRLWNATTGVEQWNAQALPEGMRSVAFSPDGKSIAVGMSDSSVTIWDVATGALLRKVNGMNGAVRQVEWSPDGMQLVTAGDDNVAHVITAAEGTVKNGLSHQNKVTSSHWSMDGTSLLTTSMDGTARVWRISEVVLQADTSGLFSYAPPPPAFARFHNTGGVVEIGKDLTVSIGLEAADQLALADIDSVQFVLAYDASILANVSSTIPVVSQRDSALYRYITLAPIPLPFTDGVLGTMQFRATLGADSITSLRIRQVTQIGSGPGIRVETVADTIRVTGICRAGSSPRLYSPIGNRLNAVIRNEGGIGTLDVQVGETGRVAIAVYDVTGDLLWTKSFTRALGDAAEYHIALSDVPAGPLRLIVISTATEQTSLLWENVR